MCIGVRPVENQERAPLMNLPGATHIIISTLGRHTRHGPLSILSAYDATTRTAPRPSLSVKNFKLLNESVGQRIMGGDPEQRILNRPKLKFGAPL